MEHIGTTPVFEGKKHGKTPVFKGMKLMELTATAVGWWLVLCEWLVVYILVISPSEQWFRFIGAS